ncbi:MAG: hypothetical protein OXC19_04785 [Bryobacterales bacterium]|nr:hypothetical protein [Bryobacterales bacterium]
MTRDPERVTNGHMDRQKSLRLPVRLEAGHVAFPHPALYWWDTPARLFSYSSGSIS